MCVDIHHDEQVEEEEEASNEFTDWHRFNVGCLLEVVASSSSSSVRPVCLSVRLSVCLSKIFSVSQAVLLVRQW